MHDHPRTYTTPLIKLDRISRELGLDVYAKLEYTQPTGSHKDRETLMMIQDAISRGYREIAIASTGNAAISLSFFSRINGLKCHVFARENIAGEKIELIKALGAELHLAGDSLREAFQTCIEYINQHNIYDANPGRNFKKIEGDSTISIEISYQLEEEPSHVIIPTNNGTLYVGIWLGFTKTKYRPKLIGAIAPTTKLADSIAGFSKLDEQELNKALNESKGTLIEVSDDEILNATKQLYKENIPCEPASATTLAALQKLNKNQQPDKPAVLIITGTAIRFPKTLRNILQESRA
ncbi:MAG: PLP-dependent lyase/thiolase [Aigarchaeota archaeon]|nr:PLP-dependent lyase/thiolase [Candidatus Pelearchaeum maunauluense]